MAHCRMISNVIVEDNQFLNLPHTAQSLYLQLLINADDEGFVMNAKHVAKRSRLTKKILNILSEHDYIIYFEETDVALIKHWYKHNRLKSVKKSYCVREKSQVCLVDNCYTLSTELVDKS